MPFVVHCPTCRHPLTVDEASAGQSVACPTCRAPLAVPAAAVPVAPADPFEPPAEEPRRARRPAQSGGVPVWAVVGALVLLVAVAIGVALAVTRGNDRALQLAETEALLLTLNREAAALEQATFWRGKGYDGPITVLGATADDLKAQSERAETALNKKWGYDRYGLAKLSNKRAADYDEFRTASVAMVKRRLDSVWGAHIARVEQAPPAEQRALVAQAVRTAREQIDAELKALEAAFAAKR